MRMKTKSIILMSLAGVLGLSVGAFFGYIAGDFINGEVNKDNTYVYPSQIKATNLSPDKGSYSLSTLEGNIGDKVLLTINPFHNAKTYELSLLEFNGEQIAENYNNTYYLTLKSGENILKIDFSEKTAANQLVSAPILDQNYENIKVDFIYEDALENSSCKINYSLTNGYDIESFFLNNKKILLDQNNEYNFSLEKENIVRVNLVEGIGGNDVYNDFLNKYKNFSDYNFVDEINKGDISLKRLAYVSFINTNNQKNISTLAYTNAVSTALLGIKNIQNVYSAYIKNDDKYFKENITSSNYVKLGERVYQNKEIEYYRTNKNISNDQCDFSNVEKETMSIEAYLSQYYLPLNNVINYQIEENYILDDSSITKTDDGYELTLNLSSQSIVSYAKYMMTTTQGNSFAEQTDLPSFSQITLTISLSNNLLFNKMSTFEKYTVYTSLSNADTEANGSIIFSYQEKEMPSLTESISYQEIKNV